MDDELREVPLIEESNRVSFDELILVAVVREVSLLYHLCVGLLQYCHEKVNEEDVCYGNLKYLHSYV